MSITGGTLQTSSGGIIRNNVSQTATLSGITNTGTFIGDNNSDTNLSGVITNSGTMTINAGASITRFALTGGSTTFAARARRPGRRQRADRWIRNPYQRRIHTTKAKATFAPTPMPLSTTA